VLSCLIRKYDDKSFLKCLKKGDNESIGNKSAEISNRSSEVNSEPSDTVIIEQAVQAYRQREGVDCIEVSQINSRYYG
jgi:hypothetical protein